MPVGVDIYDGMTWVWGKRGKRLMAISRSIFCHDDFRLGNEFMIFDLSVLGDMRDSLFKLAYYSPTTFMSHPHR